MEIKKEICIICHQNEIKNDDECISYVHKSRQYGGYSKYEYPRNFCSKECVAIFEKDFRCNNCHIISYEWIEFKNTPMDLIIVIIRLK